MTQTSNGEVGRAILDELRAIRSVLERAASSGHGDSEPSFRGRSPRVSPAPREPDPPVIAAAKAEAEARRRKFSEEQGEKLRQAAAWSSTAAWEAQRAARRAAEEQA